MRPAHGFDQSFCSKKQRWFLVFGNGSGIRAKSRNPQKSATWLSELLYLAFRIRGRSFGSERHGSIVPAEIVSPTWCRAAGLATSLCFVPTWEEYPILSFPLDFRSRFA
jgi:hypothetical protein